MTINEDGTIQLEIFDYTNGELNEEIKMHLRSTHSGDKTNADDDGISRD